MCCKKLGIGLIVLSVTLFFGITISEILTLNEIPQIAAVEENILTLEEAVLKNCVPGDTNLKYQFIEENKAEKHKVENIEELKKLIESGEIDSETEKQLKKIEKEVALRNSSPQTLVYIQKCHSEKESQ